VIEEVILSDAAEETGLDLNDQMEITKYLRGKVSDDDHFVLSHHLFSRSVGSFGTH
jgi:hypothetical protein